ncbi:MAG: penicillin-binding transpeptidase domain-containing protein [Anaerolineales bacterium]
MATHRKGSALILFLALSFTLSLGACSSEPIINSASPRIFGDISDAAAVQAVVAEYLSAWQSEDYTRMYGLLSSLSQDALSLEDFEAEYQEFAKVLTLQSLDFKLLSSMTTENHAEVAYRANYHTLLIGTLTREMMINLIRQVDGWRVGWQAELLLPELTAGNHLEFVNELPSRGRIFDRAGAPLAAYENAIALGLVPGEILPEQTDLIYETLSEVSIYPPEDIARMVDSTPDDWYLPIVSLSLETVAPYMETLRNLSGVRMDEFRSRFYVDGGVAPHAIGYRLYIPEEDLESYLRLGYRQDELVGAAGLEAAYEAELSGQHGGSLYLVGPNGKIETLLASSEPQPGQSIYTTLDKTLQMRLQASLGDQRAAVVVMELDTGRILALVSNPDFDPNAFDRSEIDQSLLESYFTDEDQPLFNRASQGQYPLGSVFKVISMSAALESGLFWAGSSFYCGQSLWVCDSVTLYDWTFSHGVAASGQLNLMEGLMRSCNPWFYHIGETLFSEGREAALSEMALGFGLGQSTGIDISEEAGNVPEIADTCVNSAQMAIGQGEILVTPLQVVSFYAALANGGILYRPALVERVESTSGEISLAFSSYVRGELPVSDETRQIVLDSLDMVIDDPRGTGYWAMQGLDIPVSGKTGTAQTPSGDSHAWFAGFTRQNDPQNPDIAVVVIIENGGEGSTMAAPVFRRAVSLYFSDNQDPGGVMPWETAPYVPWEPDSTATPTLPSDQ